MNLIPRMGVESRWDKKKGWIETRGEQKQKEAKGAADKHLQDEGKRRGHKITGMSAYTIWHFAYTDYIDKAGYKFLNGQVVLK